MKSSGISFVFPMYNEADNIAETARRATALARRLTDDYEIVIVDDASTDGSAEAVAEIASRDHHVKLIRLKTNTKFGGALREGLMNAAKAVVVYTDSDFPAREQDIEQAMGMLDGSDVVTAYSLVVKDTSLKRITMSKAYNFLVRLLFGLRLRDINSGLKIYRREVLQGMDLRSRSPFIDVEIFVEAARRGFRISQYGLIFDLRTKGSSSISRPAVVARTFFDMISYKLSHLSNQVGPQGGRKA